jgi:hypothetical protein
MRSPAKAKPFATSRRPCERELADTPARVRGDTRT